jgi:hypothetical protein
MLQKYLTIGIHPEYFRNSYWKFYAGLFFWRKAPERRSGTYLKEQNSKKAKMK